MNKLITFLTVIFMANIMYAQNIEVCSSCSVSTLSEAIAQAKDFDTIKLGTLILGIDEIRAFAKESNQYTSVFSNGAFLQTAGAGYFVVNVANSLIRKDPVFESSNLPKMGAGIGTWILGKIQAKKNPNYRPIGKRFSVAIL